MPKNENSTHDPDYFDFIEEHKIWASGQDFLTENKSLMIMITMKYVLKS